MLPLKLFKEVRSMVPARGLEPPTYWLQVSCSTNWATPALRKIIHEKWWRMTGSNRRPSACKADALPAELILHNLIRWCFYHYREKNLVTPTGFEPVLPPWKGGVLTAWPRGHIIIFSELPSGLEPLTSSLPWKCSTCWAMEAFCCQLKWLLSFRDNGSAGRIRTYDRSVNSRVLYHWATAE